MGITVEDFRKIIDKNHLLHRVDEEGDIVMGIAESENDPHPLTLIYSIRDMQVLIRAYCRFTKDAEDLQAGIAICNEWNLKRMLPKAYLDEDGTFVAEWTLLTDDDTTLDSLDSYAIHLLPRIMISFFEFVDEKRGGAQPSGDDLPTLVADEN